jgi:signal transduction histidine kinase
MARIRLSFSFKISFLYLIFGALWILFSDKLAFIITQDSVQIINIQTVKGWFFILVTATLLYIFVRREIKKRNKLIEQLQHANKRARESDELKTAFLGNLSHYIRTPMNSILGFAELLEQRNIDNEKRNRFYNLINQQSQHLLQFINNIVEVSKIQSGQLIITKKYFHLNASLKLLFRGLLLEQTEKNPKVQFNFEPGLPDGKDILFSDEDKIKHVLTNLITNAYNATKSGEVSFGYTLETNKIVFFVRDTGNGISDNIKRYIFKGFVFPAPSELKLTEGFGLGLYLSSGLVSLLNGKLWLGYSGPEGSQFCFSIPIEELL